MAKTTSENRTHSTGLLTMKSMSSLTTKLYLSMKQFQSNRIEGKKQRKLGSLVRNYFACHRTQDYFRSDVCLETEDKEKKVCRFFNQAQNQKRSGSGLINLLFLCVQRPFCDRYMRQMKSNFNPLLSMRRDSKGILKEAIHLLFHSFRCVAGYLRLFRSI